MHGELDFVSRDLLSFDPAQLTAIRRHGGEDLEFAKGADGWTFVKPAGQKLDQAGMGELAEQLAHLRVTRIIALDAGDPSRFGLDAPAATVTLVIRGAEGQTSDKVIEIGRTTSARHDEPEGSRYVRLAGSQTVGILPPALGEKLTGDALRFRDRDIAHFADADRAIVDQGGRHLTFTKADGAWKLTEPLAAAADQAGLDELVDGLRRLRAYELVAERSTDLKKFGLDEPEAHWQFFSGDKPVLNLLVGKGERNTGRRFAKLADGEMIFLLDAPLAQRLLAEHRKRELWTGIDPTQVETLIYGVGDKTLVLQKVENAWQVPGKPDQPVNAAVINELVAAFASLKIERYVADKDADLKRFGLQPPARTIVLRPRTGNPQTIYLGGYEPGSKRLYGRTYDPARNDAFVISEADSARLLKEQSDLQGK
jgi:hypothetical protein